MKLISSLICAGCLCAGVALAQSPVTLTVNTRSPGDAIPPDFIGLSFETGSLEYNSPRVKGHLFDATNGQLLTLFHNLGVKNLRIGGSSVDTNKFGYVPAPRDIDALFRFVKAANVDVIYSLRLLNGSPAQDAAAAKYVWNHYRPDLVCFAIGNEPNLYKDRDPEITNAASFVVKWKRFAAAVIHAVPDATFGGPDNGTGGATWAAAFAQAEKNSGLVTWILAHYYVGGVNGRKTARRLTDEMLSRSWDAVRYPAYYHKTGAMASALGFPYRLTELNSFVARFPGVWGGNNSFASALFALDCMHWWAAHGCRGVDFHTVVGKYNGTIYRDAHGDYQIYPIGYGIKAFDVGGHGRAVPVAVKNPKTLNLTAYAVAGLNRQFFVTILNKEHGTHARNARVTIVLKNLAPEKAAAMFLTAPGGNVEATSGITLGGASIINNAPWRGQWTPLHSIADNRCFVTMPAASAAVVKIWTRNPSRH